MYIGGGFVGAVIDRASGIIRIRQALDSENLQVRDFANGF